MLDVAISQVTTPRWELPEELARLDAAGFAAISLWRPKLSDLGAAAAAPLIAAAGVRVSSLQWAGGFTGGDGRSFAESIDDAREAIDAAQILGAQVLVVHGGCRGGHTRTHAGRLLVQAIESLLPRAHQAGVVLAVKPVHAAAGGCGFLNGLGESLDLVDRFADPGVRLALDLWHFGQDPALGGLVARLAAAAAVVQVADRCGPPALDADRLPAGHGALPLESLVADLLDAGYSGSVEFDPVGEAVEILGYAGVLKETRLVADAWIGRRLAGQKPVETGGPADGGPDRHHLRPAGSRRSHASSHSVSPG